MKDAAKIYGEALYELARSEALDSQLLPQLRGAAELLTGAPEYQYILSSPAISKAERTGLLDQAFSGQVHPYVLNFLKILTEKGYMRHFGDCCSSYTSHFDQDNGIARVTAVTAVALTDSQSARLTEKLSRSTGKQVILHNRVEPGVLGGVRLDYDGQRLDDTVSHHLDAVRELLSKTVL